jgi:hypothetical protein
MEEKMNALNTKEKFTAIVCFLWGTWLIFFSAFSYLFRDSTVHHVFWNIGISFILIRFGFTPQKFFMPLSKSINNNAQPILIKKGVYNSLLYFGLIFIALSVVFKYLL